MSEEYKSNELLPLDADFLDGFDSDESDDYAGETTAGSTITKTADLSAIDEEMATFLKHKQMVLNSLGQIEERTEQVRALTLKLEGAYDEKEMKDMQDELMKAIQFANHRVSRVKKKNTALTKSTKSFAKQYGESDSTVRAQISIRQNIEQTLQRQTVEVVRDLLSAKRK